MALSHDIVSQFAKLVDNQPKKDEGVTIKGTYKIINNVEYVQLDGSDVLTPVESTVDAKTGERVQVLIKDHFATVTGNISSPAARSKDVKDLADTVDEQGNTIQQMDNTIIQQGNSIIQMNTSINQHETTINQHDTKINQQGDQIVSINNTIIAQDNSIEANHNAIIAQGNEIDLMNDTITSHGNSITSMNNTIQQHNNRITQNSNTISQQGNNINQQQNTIQQINNAVVQQGNTITEQNSKITILNSAFVIQDGVLSGLSSAIVNTLKTDYLDSDYANIDFSNINIAAIATLFTESGIIKDLVVQQGSITGELVGVTIKGDLIEANSIQADKIVVKGEDGLYYKLNIDGLNNIGVENASKFILTSSIPEDWSTNYKDYYIISNNKYVHIMGDTAPTWTSNTYYKLASDHENALDGSTIIAHSITADRVQVTDLVAFGATIGGFVIGNASLHTTGKTTIDSNATGIYLGQDGQIYIGDADNKIKYYKLPNNTWKLEIIADEFKISGHNKTINEEIQDAEDNAETAYNRATDAQNSINNLIIGGTNLISHSDEKWTEGSWTNPTDAQPEIEQFNGRISLIDKIKIDPNTSYYIKTYSYGDEDSPTPKQALIMLRVCDIDGVYIRTVNNLNNNQWTSESNEEYVCVTLYNTSETIDIDDIGNKSIKIKMEKGTRPTDWSPCPSDIDYDIGDIRTLMNDYVTTTDYEQGIEEIEGSIKVWAGETYVTQSDQSTIVEELRSSIESKADTTTITSTANTIINNRLGYNSEGEARDGTLAKTIEEVQSTFAFKPKGLEISRQGTTTSLLLQNDELAFIRGYETIDGTDIPNKLAYFSSNAFVLNNLEQLKIGKYAFVVRANGSIDFKKVED